MAALAQGSIAANLAIILDKRVPPDHDWPFKDCAVDDAGIVAQPKIALHHHAVVSPQALRDDHRGGVQGAVLHRLPRR